MTSDQDLKIKRLNFLSGIFILVILVVLFIFLQDSFSSSQVTIVTKNGKELSLEVGYGMLIPIEKGEILKEEENFEKRAIVQSMGGSYQFIQQDQIPFGSRFGIFWYVPITDPNDSFDLIIEHEVPVKKSKKNKSGIETESYKLNTESYKVINEIIKGFAHIFVETKNGDLPGVRTLKLFYKDKLLIFKKYTVLEP